MTSVNFMDPSEPNFIWKGLNALIDMDCIIENELPEISPNKRYETITLQGRSGELHETFDDYEAYDYEIENISVPYDRLIEIRKWLTGKSKLITHNDSDKYRDAICQISEPTEFRNEWGWFYNFDISFRCQPFKRKVREIPFNFKKGDFAFFDSGEETAHPVFEVSATGGDFELQIADTQLKVLAAKSGIVVVDSENGLAMQNEKLLFTKGDWPLILPGKNILKISGNLSGGQLWNRSVFL